eukprot:gene18481-23612_t
MKPSILYGISIIGFSLLVGCGDAKKQNDMDKKAVTDPHSYAKPSDAVITHLDLNLNVNFDKKKLSGTATYTLQRTPEAKEVVLDTRDLTISKVTLDNDTAGAAFATGVPD